VAYYNANRVIKLTRKALGLTQEKLSEGVCEVETYSKIENGHRTLRRSTYQKLMEKMGRNTDRRYAVCVSKDGMLLDEKIEYERAFKRYDYDAAEEYLGILKEKVDNNILTKQYIGRAEAVVAYCRGKITSEEFINKLDEVIQITVPDYQFILESNIEYPFMKEELLALMSLGTAYRLVGNFEMGEKIYRKVLECLECDYLGNPDKYTLQITVKRNLARLYAQNRRNDKAIREIDGALELAREKDCGYKMGALLVTKAHECVELMRQEKYGREYFEHVSKYLRQAYYLAAARGEMDMANKIKEYYNKYFPDKE